MPHPSRRKGNRFEREVVNAAETAGLDAHRAYASNGKSLGEVEECDLRIGPLRASAKRRKNVAGYLTPPEGTDLTVIREDRGEALAVVPLELLLDLLDEAD